MIKTKALNFTELGDVCVHDALLDCANHFIHDCRKFAELLFNTADPSKIKPSDVDRLLVSGNYSYFQNEFGIEIEYNESDIVFGILDHTLYEYCKTYIKNNESDNSGYNLNILRYNIPYLANENILTAMFGIGEFPFMRFKIVKIANKYYYFYEIVR